ncbi:MAG: hypothetical protein IPK19_11955 [Chloroflexi bacterium]|nr:hypothetical protein [Chloroflexota bacterium]
MNFVSWAADASHGSLPSASSSAVTLNWLESNTILKISLRGDLSVEDVTRLDGLVYGAVESTPNCRAVIFDVASAGRVSPHLINLRMKRGYPRDHKLEYICIAGEHRLLRLILILTYTSGSASIQFFRDVKVALRFLTPGSPAAGTM